MKKISRLVLLISFFFISINMAHGATIIKAGTEIKVRLAEPINSKIRAVGYAFRAQVDQDIYVDNKLVIKRESKLRGIVTANKASERKVSPASISLTLKKISIKGRSYPISTYPISGQAKDNYRQHVGDDINTDFGEVPVLTTGRYLQVSEGTIMYFILSQDLRL